MKNYLYQQLSDRRSRLREIQVNQLNEHTDAKKDFEQRQAFIANQIKQVQTYLRPDLSTYDPSKKADIDYA